MGRKSFIVGPFTITNPPPLSPSPQKKRKKKKNLTHNVKKLFRITMNLCHCYFNLCSRKKNTLLCYYWPWQPPLSFLEPIVPLNIYTCFAQNKIDQIEDIESFIMSWWNL